MSSISFAAHHAHPLPNISLQYAQHGPGKTQGAPVSLPGVGAPGQLPVGAGAALIKGTTQNLQGHAPVPTATLGGQVNTRA